MEEKKLRIALKIGYLGTNYHGFQTQPGLSTIEGELFKALEKLGVINDRKEANYSSSGRTDKGVHAISQVVSFDSSNPKISPRMINSKLPNDIWAFALARPHPEFDARKDAISREYRYFFYDGGLDLNIGGMKEASEFFLGSHDFLNFSHGYGNESNYPGNTITRREIKRVEVEKRGSFIVIDIEANGFLRQMVRKIISALRMIGDGVKEKRWIKDLLELRIREDIKPAPAFGLILKNVSYAEGFKFIKDEYAREKILERMKKDLFFHVTIAEVLKDMSKTFY
jgi:tRNA pseudouridine38-40 synthase